ncbi:hypothetical protein BDV95DRAFT_631590 [Massariosphaeria phaeospora]|uniref:Membrane-associated, eicosanoid/glutathione metabolism protein n=1 Tax=Massariosphaeria phaeospora TaxID=100035 RepID=A0A7C8I713_9PLEO|nr:hypothetical protein BDV95DRAFT_631590 [Massariosphaeria phaeospora]
MTSFIDAYNLSILAVPAYYMLSIWPHLYAIEVASQGKLLEWDNRNPRSSELKSKLKDGLDADSYAKYERAEACHANGMENLPLFATAVILGNMAGLKREGLSGLTGFAGLFLATRLVYTSVYLTHRTQGLTVVRTGLWAAGTGLCLRVIVKAANALGAGKSGI